MKPSKAHNKRVRGNNNRTPMQREEAKQKFLLEYSRTKSIMHACAFAGISQSAYYQWRDSGYITQDDMTMALEGYHDNIRKKVSELALQGAKRQMRDSHGNPLFEPDGTPSFEYVVSEKILLRLYEHLPENRNQQSAESPYTYLVQDTDIIESTLVKTG